MQLPACVARYMGVLVRRCGTTIRRAPRLCGVPSGFLWSSPGMNWLMASTLTLSSKRRAGSERRGLWLRVRSGVSCSRLLAWAGMGRCVCALFVTSMLAGAICLPHLSFVCLFGFAPLQARGMEAAEFKTLTDYVPQPVVGLLGRWTSSYRAGDAVWAYQGGDASHSSSARSDERCWYAAFVWSVSSEFVVVLFDDGAMESMHHPDLLLPPSDVSPAQIRGMFDWLYAPDTQLRSDQRSCFGFADEKRNCTLALCASDSSVVKLDSSAFSGPVFLMRMWSDLTSERALTVRAF